MLEQATEGLVKAEIKLGYVDKSDTLHSKLSNIDQITTNGMHRFNSAIGLNCLSIILPLIVLPGVVTVIKKFGKRMAIFQERSTSIKIAVSICMINAWLFAITLLSIRTYGIYIFSQFLKSQDNMPEYFEPYFYCYKWGSIALIIICLLQLPYVLYYIQKSHQTVFKRQCRIARYCYSIGWIGIIFLMDIISSLIPYFILLLINQPINVLTEVIIFFGSIIILNFFILVSVVESYKFIEGLCSPNRRLIVSCIPLYLLFIFSAWGLISMELFYLLDDRNMSPPSFNSTSVLSSILAYALIGGLAYILKKVVVVVFQTDISNSEIMPLLNKATNRVP